MRAPSLFILLLLAAVPAALPAAAQSPSASSALYTATAVATDGILTLTHGRLLRLEGIVMPFAETEKLRNDARQELEHLTTGRKLTLENPATDRYGRMTAQLYALDEEGKKIWLQGEMLRGGFAFVYPPTGSETRLEEMMALEAAARRAKAGIWTDAAYADTPAGDAARQYGHYAFVSGVVVHTARAKNVVYIDFGKNWRTDFSIAIAARDLRAFREAHIDPLALEGKTLRVRGWVKRDPGLVIAVTSPAQLEELPPD